METNDLIWLISNISAIIGEGLGAIQKDLYVWYKDDAEIILNYDTKEIVFIDCFNLDYKTYYAIYGLAASKGLKFTE
jgi:hypothetical protein